MKVNRPPDGIAYLCNHDGNIRSQESRTHRKAPEDQEWKGNPS
jgi:hypothetical protein